jgi:KDO2-lipid IV(A) lauroyltransferase
MRPALYSVGCFKAGYALAQFLPRNLSHWMGATIALTTYRRLPDARAALRANLRRVTSLKDAALDTACTDNVANFGRMLADYFRCAGAGGEKRAAALVDEWCGLDHLQAARAQGRGTVLITAHLGHWELGGILLAMRGFPMTVVTLDEPSSELTRWRDVLRRQLGIKTIAVGPGREFAFLEMLEALRRNECVAMLVDRPYAGSGLPVEFFGARTEFSTAPALLAHHAGAAVLPAFVLLNDRRRYVSFADPLIPMTQGPSARAVLAENTQRIASVFEGIVRANSEQWFNYVPIWPEAL